MIVWFTSGQSLADCLRPILLFAAPFFVAIVAVVAVSVAVGRAAQARIRAPARVARRDRAAYARALPRIPPRRIWSFSSKASIRSTARIRNVFLHSVDDEQGRDDGRALGARSRMPPTATVSSCWRTAAATKASPAPPNTAIVEFEQARAPDRARRAARAADVDQGDPDRRRCSSLDGPRRARRAVLAALGADLGARADAARGPARLRESAHRDARSTSSPRRSCTCSTATASTSCRASSRRASSDFWAGLVIPHAIALGVVFLLFRPPAVARSDCFSAPAARWRQRGRRHEDADALHRPRGAAGDAADLQRAA